MAATGPSTKKASKSNIKEVDIHIFTAEVVKNAYKTAFEEHKVGIAESELSDRSFDSHLKKQLKFQVQSDAVLLSRLSTFKSKWDQLAISLQHVLGMVECINTFIKDKDSFALLPDDQSSALIHLRDWCVNRFKKQEDYKTFAALVKSCDQSLYSQEGYLVNWGSPMARLCATIRADIARVLNAPLDPTYLLMIFSTHEHLWRETYGAKLESESADSEIAQVRANLNSSTVTKEAASSDVSVSVTTTTSVVVNRAPTPPPAPKAPPIPKDPVVSKPDTKSTPSSKPKADTHKDAGSKPTTSTKSVISASLILARQKELKAKRQENLSEHASIQAYFEQARHQSKSSSRDVKLFAELTSKAKEVKQSWKDVKREDVDKRANLKTTSPAGMNQDDTSEEDAPRNPYQVLFNRIKSQQLHESDGHGSDSEQDFEDDQDLTLQMAHLSLTVTSAPPEAEQDPETSDDEMDLWDSSYDSDPQALAGEDSGFQPSQGSDFESQNPKTSKKLRG